MYHDVTPYLHDQYLLTHNQMSLEDILPDDDPAHEDGELLTVRMYAEICGVHKHTVLNWIRAGKLPYTPMQHGKYTRYYIPASAVPPMLRNLSAW